MIRAVLVTCAALLQLGAASSSSDQQQQLRHLDEEALVPTLAVAGDTQGIRGGFPVQAIPWFVAFEGGLLCGGSLIAPDIVLTSATCIEDGAPPSVRVGPGSRTDGISVGVEFGVLHPDWTGDILDGADIALLKLDSALTTELAEFNRDVQVPIVTSDLLFTMGFGILNDFETQPNLLQGLFLNYVEDCFSRLPPYNPELFVCGDATPDYGTCLGDGGGPVVISGTKSVVAVNSFSDGTCETQTVDVYTRVSTYGGWIESEVCDRSSVPPAYCDTDTDSSDDEECLFFRLFDWLF